MTVPASTRKAGPFPGNGLATSFPFAFKVFAKTDISVVFANSLGVESTLVLDSDYSVTLNANQDTTPGGSITYPISGSPMLSTQALAIVGGLAYNQTSALPSGGAYNATIVERALDRVTILVQQILEIANRGVQLAFTTASNVSSRLPAPRAFSVLGWAADGLSMTNYDPGTLGVSVSYANWRTKTFNGTGALTTFVLDTDAGVASNCDVVVGALPQTPDINFSYTPATKTITFLTGAPPSGTNNVVVRYGQALPQGSITSTGITDSTTTGRAVLTAVDAAAARTAIGAQVSGSYQTAGSGANITSLPNLAAGGLPDNSVLTADIADSQITAPKLSGGQSGSAPIFGARAWCTFNGTTTGTNAPTAGGNVSTVTRNAQGDYTATFTTAMQDANYAVSVLVGSSVGTSLNVGMVGTSRTTYPTTGIAAGSVRFTTLNAAGSAVDPDVVQIIVFR